MPDRDLKYLNEHRVIYRRDPIDDKPTQVFDWGYYYENGTDQCYRLFTNNSKIHTYSSLKYHFAVLRYLNQDMDLDKLERIFRYISTWRAGFTAFTYNESLIDNIIDSVINEDIQPPKTNPKKIIFKATCNLSTQEKLQISGRLLGRKSNVTAEAIYEQMLHIHDSGIKISNKKLAESLGCSTRTLIRRMPVELRTEIKLLNKQLKDEELQQ